MTSFSVVYPFLSLALDLCVCVCVCVCVCEYRVIFSLVCVFRVTIVWIRLELTSPMPFRVILADLEFSDVIVLCPHQHPTALRVSSRTSGFSWRVKMQ